MRRSGWTSAQVPRVAEHIITGYDQDDRPVRCVLNVLPGNRHVIIYERDGLPSPESE